MAQYVPGEFILREQDTGSDLYLLKSGLVEVISQSRIIRVQGKFDYFGERGCLFGTARSMSIRARVSTTCLRFPRSDLLVNLLKLSETMISSRIQLQDLVIPMNTLETLKPLGKGMFGEVCLVEEQPSGKRFALKSILRKTIHRYRLATSLKNEREALSQLTHPFIVPFYGSYKDDLKLHLLLEYIDGVDLFTGIRDIGLLSEEDARFYVGCLVLVLEYLHERDVLYRDLKPENVMLDQEGYPRLVDFGSAKWTTDRTYTVAGTPHYMAPEVITGKGYSSAVDYWSLGVMLYEFLCGGVPFGEEFTDPYDIYEQVLTGTLAFPPFMDALFPAKTLIEQLLSRNPSRRLGGSVSMLKRSSWLRTTDWEGLLIKSVPAPYKPGPQPLEADTDTQESQDSEEALDSTDERSPQEEWDQDY